MSPSFNQFLKNLDISTLSCCLEDSGWRMVKNLWKLFSMKIYNTLKKSQILCLDCMDYFFDLLVQWDIREWSVNVLILLNKVLNLLKSPHHRNFCDSSMCKRHFASWHTTSFSYSSHNINGNSSCYFCE